MTDTENVPVAESFPDKPVFEKDNNTMVKSIGSLALFIIAFYWYFGRDLKFVLMLVVALFIHEAGHFLAMRHFKYKDLKMFFIPLLGAYVKGEKEEISQKERAIILLAGPVPGIIIGFILYAIWLNTGGHDLLLVAVIFIVLNVFNLLPLTPLDGGNLLQTLFMTKSQRIQTAFIIFSAIGLTVITLYYKSYILLVIPFFLLLRVNMLSKVSKLKAVLAEKGIDYNKRFEELSNSEYWLIRDEIIRHKVAFAQLQPGEYKAATREKQMADLIKSLYSRSMTGTLSGPAKALYTSGWFLCFVGPVIAMTFLFLEIKRQKMLSPEYKSKMVSECIASSGKTGLQYPQEMKEYCECAADTIVKLIEAGILGKADDLTEEQNATIVSPAVQSCVDELDYKLAQKRELNEMKVEPGK